MCYTLLLDGVFRISVPGFTSHYSAIRDTCQHVLPAFTATAVSREENLFQHLITILKRTKSCQLLNIYNSDCSKWYAAYFLAKLYMGIVYTQGYFWQKLLSTNILKIDLQIKKFSSKTILNGHII